MDEFSFRGIPIHVCDKAPLYPAINLITQEYCPYCGEKIHLTKIVFDNPKKLGVITNIKEEEK